MAVETNPLTTQDFHEVRVYTGRTNKVTGRVGDVQVKGIHWKAGSQAAAHEGSPALPNRGW